LQEETQSEQSEQTAPNNTEQTRIEPNLNAFDDKNSEDDLTVGAHLRRERERQGYSLHDIAENLRLRPRQLQALEDGNYDALPGQTFVAGFLRSYANALGLDGVAVVDLYKSENSGDVGVPELAFPEPTPEGRMPGSSLLVGSCLVAILVVGGWYFYLNENTVDMEIVPELPSRLLDKLAETKESVTGDSAAVITSPSAAQAEITELPKPITENTVPIAVATAVDEQTQSVTGPVAPEDVISQIDVEPEVVASAPLASENEQSPDEDVSAEKEAVSIVDAERTVPQNLDNIEVASKPAADSVAAVAEKTVEVSPVITPEAEPVKILYPQQTLDKIQSASDAETDIPVTTSAMGVENKDARLVLVARQESWVQIKAADEELVLDRILGAGDTFMLPSKSGLILSTANAAGLELRLDGTSLGMLGRYGEIIQDMQLDPQHLKEKLQPTN
ncbi:MAG: RodZ domain-containing protein, partial [Sneathiella sp.]